MNPCASPVAVQSVGGTMGGPPRGKGGWVDGPSPVSLSPCSYPCPPRAAGRLQPANNHTALACGNSRLATTMHACTGLKGPSPGLWHPPPPLDWLQLAREASNAWTIKCTWVTRGRECRASCGCVMGAAKGRRHWASMWPHPCQAVAHVHLHTEGGRVRHSPASPSLPRLLSQNPGGARQREEACSGGHTQ